IPRVPRSLFVTHGITDKDPTADRLRRPVARERDRRRGRDPGIGRLLRCPPRPHPDARAAGRRGAVVSPGDGEALPLDGVWLRRSTARPGDDPGADCRARRGNRHRPRGSGEETRQGAAVENDRRYGRRARPHRAPQVADSHPGRHESPGPIVAGIPRRVPNALTRRTRTGTENTANRYRILPIGNAVYSVVK